MRFQYDKGGKWLIERHADAILKLAGIGPVQSWRPLTRIDGPPEPVLQQCKDVIEANTTGGEQDNLLNATEILAGLRFDKALLRRGDQMIESPVLQEWFAERDIKTRQTIVLESLEERFGPVPADVSAGIRVVTDPVRLNNFVRLAYTCASLDEFRTHLTSPPAN